MPNHKRYGRRLLLSKRKELRGKVAQHIAVESCKVHKPKAVEHREQQQRVVKRLAERFSLFDQQTGPLHSRPGFRRGKPLEVHEWGYERDLKLDLLAPESTLSGRLAIWVSARLNCVDAST